MSNISKININGTSYNIAQPDISGKLDKTTYEYSKELSCGSNGRVCLGKFPCYDTNVTINISTTTSGTYNGTFVLATQNIDTNHGGVYTASVYGDYNGALTNVLRFSYNSGSNVFSIYCDFPGWSKNAIHIKVVAGAGTPTDIVTHISEIPDDATLYPVNIAKAGMSFTGTVSATKFSTTSGIELY